MEGLISEVKPKIIFTVPQSLKNIVHYKNELGLDYEVVVFGETEEYTPFSEFIQPQPEENEFKPIIVNDCKETCHIYFSSGTSGFPKGICINHHYYYHHSPLIPPPKNHDVDVHRQLYELNIRKNFKTSCLSYGSMYWNSSGMGLFISAMTGISRVLCNNFDAKKFWYIVDKYRVSKAKFISRYITR